MSAYVARQIAVRITAKNLSIADLERAAGLNAHAVRNIIRGHSKKPSAEVLQAVSEVLGCTVKDLLTQQTTLREERDSSSKEKIMNSVCESWEFLQHTVKFVKEQMQLEGKKHKKKSTIKQSLTCVEEIYIHSLSRDPSKVDEEFGEWFISLALA